LERKKRAQIVRHFVKVENEEDLDQDSGAIGTIEFFQKRKIL
jgi:hypothetical protein